LKAYMNTIVASDKIVGDISKCKIDTYVSFHVKNSVLSMAERVTHQSYNVCTGQVVAEYTTPELTDAGMLAGITIVFVCIFSVAHILNRFNR